MGQTVAAPATPAAADPFDLPFRGSGNVFRDIVEIASEGIVIVDPGFRIRFGNPRIHDMLGYADGQLIGLQATDFLALGYAATAGTPEVLDGGALTETSAAQAYRLIHRDGHTIETLISAAHITDAAGDYAGSVAMVTDITELRRAERALHEKEMLFAIVLGNVEESVWRADLAAGQIEWSAGYSTALGPAAQARHLSLAAWLQEVHEDDRAALDAALGVATDPALPIHEAQYRCRHSNGDWRWTQSRWRITRADPEGRPLELAGTSIDITRRKQQELALHEALAEQRALNQRLEEAQNQLLQSEKMASLGQLAAGVAHELNNPIGFIQSNMTTLSQYLDEIFQVSDAYERMEGTLPDAPWDEVRQLKQGYDFAFLRDDIGQLMRESFDGIDRVTRIVRDLKDFSRSGETSWVWADIHECIDSTLNIARNELKYKCQITRDFATLPRLYCVPSQLNQVFMNLFVNAAHAITERGDLIITTRPHGQDAVRITVADSGSGMPPEVARRVFEPFFTTKPTGRGTGLGLSIAYGIIKRHGGVIEVASQPGRGTTFTLTLPVQPPQETAS